MKASLNVAATYLVVSLIVWLIVSTMVFALRHPWATQTERMLHVGDALLFRKVPYREMRGL